jgi:hypothetical protein
MTRYTAIFLFAIAFVISSCRKEEPEPQPLVWNEDWVLFTGTIVEIGPYDTSYVGFSSNQGYSCNAYSTAMHSLMPMESEATYRSELWGNPGFEVHRGVLYFTGSNFGDRPDDTAFVNYFRSGYYTLSEDMREGFNIIYRDEFGYEYSSSAYINYFGPQSQSMYMCRITDYHPFMRNGVQYVKVKMHFNNIYLCGGAPGNIFLVLNNADFEGYFRND